MGNNTQYYKSRFVFDKDRIKVWKAINEYLQYFIPKGASILDIGCGYSDFINGIVGEKKYGIDLNEQMINFVDVETVKFYSQSVLDEFPLSDECIDVIFASNLFEHFDDEQLKVLMKNISKKLKKGGILILIQPNYYYAYREYWDDYTHKKAFSHESLKDFLISFDYDIVLNKKKFIPFSLKSRLPKSYFLTKCYIYSPIKPMGKQMLMIAKKN